MKKAALKIYLMIFLQLTCFLTLYGQQSEPDQAGERVILFSDRTLYIAGEQILFSAFLQCEVETNQAESSRVLYCEIITPGGTKIAGNKFLINNYSTSGYLNIPKDLITGIYYLRAYTRFMRNYGPYYYHYTLIKIVNANREEVQGLTNKNSLSESLNVELNPENADNSFLISVDKSQYFPRDTVHLSIDEIAKVESSWKGLSLAVVPEFSISANRVKLPENGQFGERSLNYRKTY
jgi:hypothetical protein